MDWKPISTRPEEGEFLATVCVYSNSTKAFSHWDTHVLLVQEDGTLAEDHGWALEDYEFWCPIPEYPPVEPAIPMHDGHLLQSMVNSAFK